MGLFEGRSQKPRRAPHSRRVPINSQGEGEGSEPAALPLVSQLHGSGHRTPLLPIRLAPSFLPQCPSSLHNQAAADQGPHHLRARWP